MTTLQDKVTIKDLQSEISALRVLPKKLLRGGIFLFVGLGMGVFIKYGLYNRIGYLIDFLIVLFMFFLLYVNNKIIKKERSREAEGQ